MFKKKTIKKEKTLLKAIINKDLVEEGVCIRCKGTGRGVPSGVNVITCDKCLGTGK